MVWERRVYSNKMGAKVGQLRKNDIERAFRRNLFRSATAAFLIMCLLWEEKTTFKKRYLNILWLILMSSPKTNNMILWSNLFIMRCEINKLRPMGGDWSAAQMGQHSPNGISGLGQSFSSSQTISSHRMVPVSHTQMRQGSGFHTSLSL